MYYVVLERLTQTISISFFSIGLVVKFHSDPFEVEYSRVDLKLGEGEGEVAEGF